MASSRFAVLEEDDLDLLLDMRDSVNTKRVIKASVEVFKAYMEEKEMSFDECMSFPSQEMNCLLRKFYAETKRVNGEVYAKKSMISLRYGLQKHFLKTRKEDIINDESYKTSNEMFKAVLVKLKKDGVGESKQKEAIAPEDLSKLYDTVFSTETPTGLQKKTIFEYLYYFCNRGRENIRELQKEDFSVSMDSTGREYVTVRERQTKNHRGDDLQDNSNNRAECMIDLVCN